MIRSSIGQMNAELAKSYMRSAGNIADTLVKSGKIVASERGIAFAKLASPDLTKSGIKVSKDMVAMAGKKLPFVDALVAKVAGSSSPGMSTTATTVATSVGTVAMRQTASHAAKSTVRGAAPVAVGLFFAEGIYTAVRYSRGHTTGAEARRRTVRSAASNAGGVGGAAAGAAIGSVVPVLGTAVGAVVGGIFGGILSGYAAGKLTSQT